MSKYKLIEPKVYFKIIRMCKEEHKVKSCIECPHSPYNTKELRCITCRIVDLIES